jgi:hypothetical protein
VVGSLLVALVEPVQVGEADPERQHDEEKEELGRPAPGAASTVVDDELGQRERGREADDVGERQHPADEPAAPLRDRGHRAADGGGVVQGGAARGPGHRDGRGRDSHPRFSQAARSFARG